MDYQKIREAIFECYKRGDWISALDVHRQSSGKEGGGGITKGDILWPKPTPDDLQTMGEALKRGHFKVKRLISIGCGTGFLEWALHQATGLEVIGIELDSSYWSLPFARPKFLDNVLFPGDPEFGKATRGDKETAIVFCYFNNRKAFRSYLDEFMGPRLLIIGSSTHSRGTDPSPLAPSLPGIDLEILPQGVGGGEAWTLVWSREIGGYGSGDYAALYQRHCLP